MKYAQLFIFTVQSQLFKPSSFRHPRFFEPVVVNSLGFVSVRFYLLFFEQNSVSLLPLPIAIAEAISIPEASEASGEENVFTQISAIHTLSRAM